MRHGGRHGSGTSPGDVAPGIGADGQPRGRERRLIGAAGHAFACALLAVAGYGLRAPAAHGSDPLAASTFFRPGTNVSHSKGESRLARTSPRSLSLDPRGAAYLFWSEAITHSKGVTPELMLARSMPAAGWDTTFTPIGRWEGDPSIEPACALDPNHILHVVWLDQSEGMRSIWGMRFSMVTGEVLSKDVISDPTMRAADPAIAVDPAGNSHVVWSELGQGKSSLMHRLWNPETGWGPVTTVPSVTGKGAFAPDITCNAAGELRVVWQESSSGMIAIGLVTRAAAGTWDKPTLISDTRPGWYATAPVIAAAPAADTIGTSGTASEVVVWQENDGTNSRLRARVREAIPGQPAPESAAGGWQPVVTLAEGDPGRRLEEPSVALGADRVVHLLWTQVRDTDPASEVHYLRWTGGQPGESRALTVPGSGPYATPMIAVDAGGRVMAVWVDLGEGAGDLVSRVGVAGFGMPLGTGGY